MTLKQQTMKENNKQQKENAIEGFVFYISYFEAIGTLSSKNQLIAYEAIAKYAFYGEEVADLPVRVLAIFKMAKPNIDANRRKYLAKKKRKSQTNQESTPIQGDYIEKVSLPKKEDRSETEDDFSEN